MDTIISLASFAILTLLWAGFGAALLFNRKILDDVWRSFRRSPLLVQFALAFLVLPVVAGLWIWNTRWPVWLRLTLVAGLAWMTVYTFFPRLPMS